MGRFYLMRTPEGGTPKRGDLMQTAVGTKRERTWLIWFAKPWDLRRPAMKFRILRVRWWEIDPETRVALWTSAERHGGQTVWFMSPNKAPKLRRSIQEVL